ncbi:MAG: hypothetical protein FJZ00_14870, partial [Candidatus Sericytochromatia bacterium]|nr:hypothetical protein [Candidatus Tanganyikabacteria bacterium]
MSSRIETVARFCLLSLAAVMTVTACGGSPTQAPTDVKVKPTTPAQPPAQAPAPPPEDNQKIAREYVKRAAAAFGALKS